MRTKTLSETLVDVLNKVDTAVMDNGYYYFWGVHELSLTKNSNLATATFVVHPLGAKPPLSFSYIKLFNWGIKPESEISLDFISRSDSLVIDTEALLEELECLPEFNTLTRSRWFNVWVSNKFLIGTVYDK